MQTKLCSYCKFDLPIENFLMKKSRGKMVYQAYCRECNKEKNRIHYRENKETYLQKNKDYKKVNQEKMLDYLQNKSCTDCGNNDIRVLEFDHLEDKKANVSNALRSWCWESLLKEIAKCEIVCCNCHRIRTLERSGSYRAKKVATI